MGRAVEAPARPRPARRLGLALLVAGLALAAGAPAHGLLLDNVARLSEAMNQLVDVLLERASLFADLVIEASLEERCLRDCQEGAPDAHQWAELVRQEAREARHRLGWLNRSSGEPSGAPSSSCKILGLALDQADLPAEGMDSCCARFTSCYASCAADKLHCDLELQVCLKTVCKASFARQAAPADAEPAPVGLQRDKYRACRLAGKVLIIGNLAFGCLEFKRAQRAACCRAPGA